MNDNYPDQLNCFLYTLGCQLMNHEQKVSQQMSATALRDSFTLPTDDADVVVLIWNFWNRKTFVWAYKHRKNWSFVYLRFNVIWCVFELDIALFVPLFPYLPLHVEFFDSAEEKVWIGVQVCTFHYELNCGKTYQIKTSKQQAGISDIKILGFFGF